MIEIEREEKKDILRWIYGEREEERERERKKEREKKRDKEREKVKQYVWML